MIATVRIAKRVNGVLNKPAGTRLIRELIGLQKYCTIVMAKTNSNHWSAMIRMGQLIAGMAANAYVRIRAAQATEFAPLYIILGHELIHAYHHMTGTNRIGDAQYIPYRTPVFEEAEELITVGLNAFPLDYTGVWVTENRLRAENGLPPRLVY